MSQDSCAGFCNSDALDVELNLSIGFYADLPALPGSDRPAMRDCSSEAGTSSEVDGRSEIPSICGVLDAEGWQTGELTALHCVGHRAVG